MKNLDLHIQDKYPLVRRLGDGSFKAVYLATDLNSGKEVAVKLEYHMIDPSLLRDEYEIYELLVDGKGILKVYWFERESEYRVMILFLDFNTFTRRMSSIEISSYRTS